VGQQINLMHSGAWDVEFDRIAVGAAARAARSEPAPASNRCVKAQRLYRSSKGGAQRTSSGIRVVDTLG